VSAPEDLSSYMSKMILDGKEEGSFLGINITRTLAITHLLFVDDIVIFGNATLSEWGILHGIFERFSLATGMQINFEKSVLIPYGISQVQLEHIHALFPTQLGTFENGLKYLGYYIKANNYLTSDWHWMLRRVDLRIRSWCNRFLSLGGRLTLLSSVLLTIPVYWFTLAQLPVAISEALRKLMVNFLWGQNAHSKKYHLVSWQQIFLPRRLGGGA